MLTYAGSVFLGRFFNFQTYFDTITNMPFSSTETCSLILGKRHAREFAPLKVVSQDLLVECGIRDPLLPNRI